MINKNAGNLFDEYAYRVATRLIANTEDPLEEGSWISLDANGKVVPADGTKLAFLNLTSNRTGRDNVSPQGYASKASYLLGQFELTVANSEAGDTAFDSTKTYACMTPLVVAYNSATKQGILKPHTPQAWTVDSSTHAVTVTGEAPDKIVAYALGAAANGTLRICCR